MRTFIFLFVGMVAIVSIVQAQYFTKTAKSLPRLGRRDGYTHISSLFKNGDTDGDGCISADELMAMFSQYGQNFEDEKDFHDKRMDELLQLIISRRK